MNAATLAGALGALGLLLPGAGQAGRFEHGLSAGLTAEYDSNPALSASAANAVWRLTASPAYSLKRAAGADEWDARLGLRLERSSNAAVSAGREDPSLNLSWRRATPTGGFGLSLGYEKASTRVTEFQDTGLVAADGSRVSQSLAGNWSLALDERRSLAFNASHSAVSYRGGTLTDYRSLGAGLTYSMAWDERAEPYLRLSASRHAPDAGAASNSYDFLAGLRLSRSERLNLDLAAGLNRTVSSGASNASGSRGGWQGSVKLDYALDPRSNFSLDLGRSVASSGGGGFSESDQLAVHWSRALAERDTLGADLSWRKSRTLTAGDTRQLNLWGSRALGDLWSLRLSYQFRQREGGGVAAASGQVLALTLSYAHPDFLDF